MSYNKKYLLERIIDVQNIVLQHKENGATQEWVYRNVVRKRFHISHSTFCKYMACNARRELKELNNGK